MTDIAAHANVVHLDGYRYLRRERAAKSDRAGAGAARRLAWIAVLAAVAGPVLSFGALSDGFARSLANDWRKSFGVPDPAGAAIAWQDDLVQQALRQADIGP